MEQTVLEIQNLCKNYGSIKAVNNLSLKVEAGAVYGILGPNGSGKTTTLGILMDIINPDSGNFLWFGQPSTKFQRKKIGAIIEEPVFYPYLSAIKNLKIIADIKNCNYSEIERVLKMVGLYPRRFSKFRTYSLGMKQRLAIAGALLGDAEVLILDEPTNGLDPKGIAEIRQIIMEIAGKGITIIIASHILDEVQKICTDVAVLSNGRKIDSGKVSEVLSETLLIEVAAHDMKELKAAAEKHKSVRNTKQEADKLLVEFSERVKADDFNRFLFSEGVTVSHLSMQKKSLEKYFLEVLKGS